MAQTKQIKLIDFLNSSKDYEGELFSQELEENKHSFSWDNNVYQFTSEGKEHFKKILNSKILIVNNNIELLDKTITQKEYDLFMETIAGYVGEIFFNKMLQEVKKK